MHNANDVNTRRTYQLQHAELYQGTFRQSDAISPFRSTWPGKGKTLYPGRGTEKVWLIDNTQNNENDRFKINNRLGMVDSNNGGWLGWGERLGESWAGYGL